MRTAVEIHERPGGDELLARRCGRGKAEMPALLDEYGLKRLQNQLFSAVLNRVHNVESENWLQPIEFT